MQYEIDDLGDAAGAGSLGGRLHYVPGVGHGAAVKAGEHGQVVYVIPRRVHLVHRHTHESGVTGNPHALVRASGRNVDTAPVLQGVDLVPVAAVDLRYRLGGLCVRVAPGIQMGKGGKGIRRGEGCVFLRPLGLLREKVISCFCKSFFISA